MGIFGALFSGISGLRAQGVSLATISDNIANVSTIGYKGTTAHFSSFVTEQASRFSYSSGGVRAVPTSLIDRQGDLEGSSSSTDLAISGDGFFVVSTSNVAGQGELRYTRAGSFTVDREGNLVNISGHYLMGWPTDNEGQPIVQDTTTTAQLQLVNINNLLSAAIPTSRFSLGANLPTGTVVGSSHTAAATVFDGFGGPHGLPLTFTRQPSYEDELGRLQENVWNISSRAPDGASVIELKDNEGNTFSASGRLDFNAIPEEGETLIIGDVTFEFDTGDGVADGNIRIPLREINSVQDATTALQTAYYTHFGRFEGPLGVALASELATQGGRFSALPQVRATVPGTVGEAAFNILQAAFEPDTAELSLDLETVGEEVRLVGKTNLAFGVDNENIEDESFGRDSADLSGVGENQTIRIYARNTSQAGGALAIEVARITVGAGGIEAGTDGRTTQGAISLSNFVYQSGGYPAFTRMGKDAAVTTPTFNGDVTATVQDTGVSAAANTALGNLPATAFNDATRTLSLDLQTMGFVAAAGANPQVDANEVVVDGVTDLSFQLFNLDGTRVGADTSTNFGADSVDLSNVQDGQTLAVFVNDAPGAVGNAVRVATIQLNDGALNLGDVNANRTTTDAITISGFTYDPAADNGGGYSGTAQVTAAGTLGGFFSGGLPTIQAEGANIPESVRTALAQTGRLTGANNDRLSFDLGTVGAEIRLQRLTNISYRTVTSAGVPIAGGLNAYNANSPNLANLAADDMIEIYIDSNGTASRGDPVKIATLTVQDALTAGIDGGLTRDALQIEGFANYTPGGFTGVDAPIVAGVTPNPGGDFPEGTTSSLPESGVSPVVEARLNGLGADIFNDVTRTLNLRLRTIADPSGGSDRQTHIAPIPGLAFVHNSGGTNPTPPTSGTSAGAFNQPSVDLTQGIAAGDTIDIYSETGGTSSLIAQITLPGPLSDVGTEAGTTTANALQISGFNYQTDRRLAAGTGVDNQTVFFEQNLEGGTVIINASDIRSINQDRSFVVPSIIAANPPNVIFTGRGTPNSFNLSNAIIQWSNGAQNSEIDIDLGTAGGTNGLVQSSDPFSVRFVRQDGVPSGVIAGVQVGENGNFLARFDNGRNQPVYRLPLATFPNTNALGQDSGNVYSPTSDSGEPLLSVPGIGSTGRIAQNSLETSTVDIANEFSRMIITQRAFSAASRVVTTADEMLDELVRIKR